MSGSGAAPRLPPACRLVALERVDSTNEEAKRLAETGAAEGTLVWSREQTAGRGRRGRSWASPPGNLYLSILLRPGCLPGAAPQIGFVAAVALGEALLALLPPDRAPAVRFKWPNDLLVDGRKISGILLDASTGPDGRLEWLVLGVGVNVAFAPPGTRYGAIALQEAGAPGARVEALLEGFATAFFDWLERWRREGFAPVRERWLTRAVGLGEAIEIRLDREILAGRFVAIEESGALALELPQGGRRTIAAGEVSYPAP